VSLSVCILTRDEEDNLPRCLASLAGLPAHVVVLDSHSTDGTRALAAAAGAEVHEEDWRGMAGQRARVLELAATPAGAGPPPEWVLCLDADEWLDPELAAAVQAVVHGGRGAGAEADGVEGYELNRRTFYLGGWIDHCGWSPEWRLRLVRAGRARVEGEGPHDRLVVGGRTGRLPGRLNHRPYRSLAAHLGKLDRYTDEMAQSRHARGEHAGWGALLCRPPGRFLRMYVLRLGFADGWRGLVVSAMGAFYVFLKYAKLRELQRGRAPPPPGA